MKYTMHADLVLPLDIKLLHCMHCKNALLFWQLHLSPELQLWHGLRDDAMLAPCEHHLQRTWSTPRIDICPHKDPCQCKNWLTTLTTLWYPKFTLVSETNCIRHLPGSWLRSPHWQSWKHPQGHYNCVVMGIFMLLMATGASLTAFSSWDLQNYGCNRGGGSTLALVRQNIVEVCWTGKWTGIVEWSSMDYGLYIFHTHTQLYCAAICLLTYS